MVLAACHMSKRGRQQQSQEKQRSVLRDEEITKGLLDDKGIRLKERKFLFLGPQGSGKSTFIKTAHLTRDKDAFSEDYRRSLRSAVFSSIIETMRRIINELEGQDLLPQDGPLEPHILAVLEAPTPYEHMSLDAKLSDALQSLWSEEIVKCRGYDMVESRGTLVEHPAKKYLDDLLRISSDDYIPSPEDVIRLHIPTRGVEETVFELSSTNCERTVRLFEVGHMVSLRRKWLPYVSDVDGIVFVAPLSQYDGRCANSEGVTGSNQLQEAVSEFGALVQSRKQWFPQTALILMLNGVDKFKKRLESKPLADAFPDFKGEGENQFTDAARFILRLFLDQVDDEDRSGQIYPVFTESSAATNVRFTLANLYDFIGVWPQRYVVCTAF